MTATWWQVPSSSGRYELMTMMLLPAAASDLDQFVDLVLAADIDAAGRLVHDEDVAVMMDHPRDSDLLLVAA